MKEVVSAEEWALRCDLAACYQLVAMHGWSDQVFTHISARIPGSDHHFLINPYGLMFDEITASSLIRIDLEGNILNKSDFGVNKAGFVIHGSVHEVREDVTCVLHTHTRAGVAVSAQRCGVLPISQQSTLVLSSLAYHDYEGVALRDEEKPRLQTDLGQSSYLMLRNHGLLTVGRTVADAFFHMYVFETTCQIQIAAQAGGQLIEVDPSILKTAHESVATQTAGQGGQFLWPALLRKLVRNNSKFNTRESLMSKKVKTALPAMMQPALSDRLPDWVSPAWFGSKVEGLAVCRDVEIGWLDLMDATQMTDLIEAATSMRWFNTLYAGLDQFPLDTLKRRNVTVTNGAGVNAITIAEYVVLGMLTVAKGYREVVRAQDRHEWLTTPPGRLELFGTQALVIGSGAIGQLVTERLTAFGVNVTGVRRSPRDEPNMLGPHQWRSRLSTFDWVILALPATPETKGLFGNPELRAMKPSGVLLNVARGTVVDQDALLQALRERRIAGAFLDVTDPEPLPSDHPLWSMENVHISMHLSGRSQDRMGERAALRFLENLELYNAGQPMMNEANLGLGY